jgi:hypothetical protein
LLAYNNQVKEITMVDGNVNVANNTAVGKTSVFLAWSGSVSQKMAVLLRGNLPIFVRNIDIFMSEDITKGKRWDTEIAKALGSTKFGILCLTPENLTSEWIHFEAGALSKTIDDSTHVCPLLLDVKKSDLKEPLASFQATLFDKEEFRKLIKALAHVCGDILEDGQYTRLMDGLWPKIEESINILKAELAEARRKSGKPEDTKPKIDPLLEEVVIRVREQGRLLSTLAEQGGAGLGKEIIGALHDIKMSQLQTMMDLSKMNVDDRRRSLREPEKEDSAREMLRCLLMPKEREELADILQKLPPEFAAKNDPEVVFNILMRTGQLGERMVDAFGGRTGTINAISFMMECNKHRPIAAEDPK